DLVAVVLVEAHVGEELAGTVVAERGIGERLGRIGPGAGLDLFGIDGHGAGGNPGRAYDHALPAILDGLDAADAPTVLLVERQRQVRLIVQAVEALDHGLLDLVDRVRGLTGRGVDL